MQKAIGLKYSQPDSAIHFANQFVSESKDSVLIGEALHTMAVANWIKGDYIESLNSAYGALNVNQASKNDTGISKAYNDIGLNYWKLKNSKRAMTNYLQALEFAERTDNDPTLARALGNIGILYEEQEDYEKALEFQGRCLELARTQNEDRLMANTLNNISLIYSQKEELEKAEHFAHHSLNIRKKQNDQLGIAQALNLLGVIAQDSTQFILADSLFQEALSIYLSVDNVWGQAMVLGNIGSNYNRLTMYKEGMKTCYRSYNISTANNLEWKISACRCIAESHANLGRATESNEWWNKWRELRDSLYNHNLENDLSLLVQRFEHEKLETELRHEAELSHEETKRQRLLTNASVGIGMMALLLFFVLYRNYQGKQRDNELLEEKNREISGQKAIIEEKNTHITDSIEYAKNLQQAILPKHASFEGRFERHFIFYRPKDIVSGDFYWLEDVNGTTFVAVVDCTGHGVPGAMVSMVGYQGLNKAVREKQLSRPSEILQSLSDHVEEQFEKSGGSVKDGMDIALFSISKNQRNLTFAGAHNPLLVVSRRTEIEYTELKESTGGWNMFLIKSNRRSVGGFFDSGPFTDHKLQLEKGDTLFLFSDGYADQFGGEKDKKLGIKRLREVLLRSVVDNDFESLESFYNEWKGNTEQIDDVSLIALTI